MSALRAAAGTAPVLLALVLAPGCLQFDEVDLFPVCEDRRAEGPSPTYTTDELLRRATVSGGASDAQVRALLDAARTRVLTMQGAPYRAFEAGLAPADGEDRWRFRANGTSGLDEATNDTYDFLVRLEGTRAFVVAPADAPHPTPAPPAIARLALAEVARDPAVANVRNATPDLAGVWLDPDLPACAFVRYEGPDGGRAEVVVNLVRLRVVHVERDI